MERLDFLHLAPEDIEVFQYTISNYAWALDKCYQKVVADCGAGTGFGSYLLSLVAKQVFSLDKNIDEFHLSGITTLLKWDALTEKPPQADVYVAFEFLEHLTDPKYFVANLPSGSTLLFTTPLEGGLTEYHVTNFTIQSLRELFTGHNATFETITRRDGQIHVRGIVVI